MNTAATGSGDDLETGAFSPTQTLHGAISAATLRGQISSAMLGGGLSALTLRADPSEATLYGMPSTTTLPKTLRDMASATTLLEEGKMGVQMKEYNTIDITDGSDPETAEEIAEARERVSVSGSIEDILYVEWEGPHDPENPKNWSTAAKWAATLIVSTYAFISPVASSIIAPASENMAAEFGLNNNTVTELATSIFVLAYGFGPLILGPLSEIYGRAPVLHMSNLWFLAWNIGCGFAQNTGQIIAFRFLAGLGGSAPLAIGGGVLGDCWRAEERGQAISLFSLAPLLGPVIGPIAGAWVAEKSTWRWTFWSTSIVTVLVQVVAMWFLRESYAPIVLERKAKQVRRTLNLKSGSRTQVVAKHEGGGDRHWKVIVVKALVRPFQLFFKEPIVQLLGLYMAFIYGLLYLFLTTVTGMFVDIYHQEIGIAGLHYIALGLGIAVVSLINAQVMDRIYIYYRKRDGNNGKPEYRLPPMIPGTILLPVGLFLTGWTAREDIHWIVPDIGIALVGAGNILNFQSIQTYVIDAFTLHAASALAAVMFLRSLAAFGFPLFAPIMYKALGYGKGDTILACFSIAIGCPAPYVFWKYGERFRKASKYAAH